VTLIVPFISQDFVALASDRRITWLIGGAPTKWEDTENKAIVVAGHFLMGYTGFARLGNVKTEQWVVEKLQGVDPSSDFRLLATQAESAVKAMHLPLKRSGHAFVAVGYGALKSKGTGELEALAITVSNAVGDSEYGEWHPKPTFSIRRTPSLASPDDFRLNAFGMPPPRAEMDKAVDLIRRYRKRHRDRALGVLQLMVDLIRRQAERCDGVSKDVSVSVLPRGAVPATAVTAPVASGLVVDPIQSLTCMFVPSGSSTDKAEVYIPAIVAPGFMVRGGEIWTEKPPWWSA
jgi:hypothetical protein